MKLYIISVKIILCYLEVENNISHRHYTIKIHTYILCVIFLPLFKILISNRVFYNFIDILCIYQS